MSGGKIQGNREPEDNLSADEVIARARSKSYNHETAPAPTTGRIDNFGAPSPDHERPLAREPERDPAGIPPGRG